MGFWFFLCLHSLVLSRIGGHFASYLIGGTYHIRIALNGFEGSLLGWEGAGGNERRRVTWNAWTLKMFGTHRPQCLSASFSAYAADMTSVCLSVTLVNRDHVVQQKV